MLQFEGEANVGNEHEGDAKEMLVTHCMNDKLCFSLKLVVLSLKLFNYNFDVSSSPSLPTSSTKWF
jgi:hypothetical protein